MRNMRMARSLLVTAATVVSFGTASPASAERYGVAVGAVEALDTSPSVGHAAVYANGGGFMLFTPADWITIAPGLSLEYSPDIRSWGAVASCVTDVPISGTPLGVDVITLLLHDQFGGDFTNASLYVGAGVGGSWFLDDHWTLSLAWNHYLGVLHPAARHSMGPTGFLGYTF